MSKLLWFIKQLLPLTYRSHYMQYGRKVFHVWRMWFGQVFDQECYEIGNPGDHWLGGIPRKEER